MISDFYLNFNYRICTTFSTLTSDAFTRVNSSTSPSLFFGTKSIGSSRSKTNSVWGKMPRSDSKKNLKGTNTSFKHYDYIFHFRIYFDIVHPNTAFIDKTYVTHPAGFKELSKWSGTLASSLASFITVSFTV